MFRFHSSHLSCCFLPIFLFLGMQVLPAQDIPEGAAVDPREKVKELAFLIGEWEYTDPQGNSKRVTSEWINHQSFIYEVDGGVTRIWGWDVQEQEFAVWTFGGLGGYGRATVTKEGNVWRIDGTPYYIASGEPVVSTAEMQILGPDTQRITGQFQNEKLNTTFRRVMPNDSNEAIEKGELNTIELRLLQALVNRNTDYLKSLMTEDCSIVLPDGKMRSREEYIELLTSDLQFTKCEDKSVEIRFVGETAIMIGASTTAGTFRGDAFSEAEIWTQVFIKVDGAWRLSHCQVAKVGE